MIKVEDSNESSLLEHNFYPSIFKGFRCNYLGLILLENLLIRTIYINLSSSDIRATNLQTQDMAPHI